MSNENIRDFAIYAALIFAIVFLGVPLGMAVQDGRINSHIEVSK